MKMKQLIITICTMLPMLILVQLAVSQDIPSEHSSIVISTVAGPQFFPLKNKSAAATIYYDKKDALVVEKAAQALQNDIAMVTGKKPMLKLAGSKLGNYPVIIGTVGQSALISQLQQANKLDISKVAGKWETFGIAVVHQPFKNVQQALVIFGSDRRGTAFGVFELSKMIGVSPFYWWADVPVAHQEELYVSAGQTIVGPPSVKYRGIFINDEDWGLHPWAAKTFDPELKDIGPRTYAKVFELMLRLKANTIWPAMHPISGAFNKYPANKLVADSFAIVTSSAHPEPLLFNNASEWDVKTMGPWNYETNKEGILKVLNNRVKGNVPYESAYTIALRGIHDAGMVNNLPLNEKVKLLESAIADERAILSNNIPKPIETIPQIFIPYKEVLDIYEAGLKVPDDITIVWPDDNFGYIKRLSNAAEQKRSGGSGVYYHVSYLGEPHDYLWFSTTPPALMYEELKKAYDTGGDRFWMLNVGDIKGCEYSTALFMDMAWDMKRFSFDNINAHGPEWLANIFGQQYLQQFAEISKQFYHLAFIHKPEYMGGGLEWNNQQNTREKISDTKFSAVNYNEVYNRLDKYDSLANQCERIFNQLDSQLKPAFFELLYYPVKASAIMNKQMLYAQENRTDIFSQFPQTNFLQVQAMLLHDSLASLTAQYNELQGGKWKHMMTLTQGYTASYFNMPPTQSAWQESDDAITLLAEGETQLEAMAGTHKLPGFNPFSKRKYFVDIYNKGSQPLQFTAAANQPWIKLTKTAGELHNKERIWVTADWEKTPKTQHLTGEIVFTANNDTERVTVIGFAPQSITPADVKGIFVEDNGVVSINAAGFHRKKESDDIKIEIINGLGIENASVKLGNATDKIQDFRNTHRPGVEYDFYTFQNGQVDIYTYALPVFALDNKHDSRYGVSIDSGITINATVAAPEYSQQWGDNVLRNYALYKSSLYLPLPGKHTLQLYCTDPGMVIQKIVIDLGGLKKSFVGPPVGRVE